MEADLVQYVRRAENAELEIQKLVKELELLEKKDANGYITPATGGKLNELDLNKHTQTLKSRGK